MSKQKDLLKTKSSSSRNERFTEFDSGKLWSQYGTKNLEEFSRTLPKAKILKYDKMVKDLKAKLLKDAGFEDVNKDADADEMKKRAIKFGLQKYVKNPAPVKVSASTDADLAKKLMIADKAAFVKKKEVYTNLLKEAQFNFLKANASDVKKLTQSSKSEGAAITGKNRVSEAEVDDEARKYGYINSEDKFVFDEEKNGGKQGFIEWYLAQNPLGFRINAIKHFAKLAGVVKFSSIGSKTDDEDAKTGDAKLLAFDEEIRKQLVEGIVPASKSRTKSKAKSPAKGSNINSELKNRGIDSLLKLESETVPVLKEIASNHGITVPKGVSNKEGKMVLNKTTKKEDYVRAIAAAAGFGKTMSKEDAIDAVRHMLTVARGSDLQGEGVAAARKLINSTDAHVFKLAKASDVVDLAKVANYLEDVPKKSNVTAVKAIELMKGIAVSKSSSALTKDKIIRNRQDCYDADYNDVVSVAKDLGLSVFGNEDQVDLCNAIFKVFLERLSATAVSRVDSFREILKEANAIKRDKLVAKLSKELNLKAGTLRELLKEWLTSHYKARVLNFYPAYEEEVDTFLNEGTLPESDAGLQAFTLVFGDILRELFDTDSSEEKRKLLQALYKEFIIKLEDSDQEAYDKFVSRKSSYSSLPYGRSPSKSPSKTVSKSPAKPLSAKPLTKSPSKLPSAKPLIKSPSKTPSPKPAAKKLLSPQASAESENSDAMEEEEDEDLDEESIASLQGAFQQMS